MNAYVAVISFCVDLMAFFLIVLFFSVIIFNVINFFQIYQASESLPDGCFYPPTLVTNVSTTSKIVIEEVRNFYTFVFTFENVILNVYI